MYRILIADDEPIVADSLAEFIDWKGLGYEVAAVSYSVEDALARTEEQMVDVILTDIIMGEQTGLQLLEQVLEKKPDIIGVIISGHENFTYARTAIHLGVYDYLVKPVDLDELTEVFVKIRQKLDVSGVPEAASGLESEEQKQSEGIIINRVKDYMEANYGESITLKLLAEQVYVHPVYLSSLFKKKTGRNFKEYLTDVRMRKAKELLGDLSLRVTDVGTMVGYDSQKHFSKVFREVFHMTPSEYRNSQCSV